MHHPANKLHWHHLFSYKEIFLTIYIQLGALIKGQEKLFSSFSHQPNQHQREGNSEIIQTLTQTARPATGSEKKKKRKTLSDQFHHRCLQPRLWLLTHRRHTPQEFKRAKGKRERDGGSEGWGGECCIVLHHMPNKSLSANLWGIWATASKAEFLTEGDE